MFHVNIYTVGNSLDGTNGKLCCIMYADGEGQSSRVSNLTSATSMHLTYRYIPYRIMCVSEICLIEITDFSKYMEVCLNMC